MLQQYSRKPHVSTELVKNGTKLPLDSLVQWKAVQWAFNVIPSDTIFIEPLTHCNDISQHSKQTVMQDSTTEWIFTDSICIMPCLAYRALRHGSDGFTCKLHHACLCKHSPDGATPNWGSRYPIAAYYSFIDPGGMKGWVGLVGWIVSHGLRT